MVQRLFFSVLILLQFTMFSQNNCNALLKSKMANKALPAEFNVLVQGNISQIIKNENLLGVKVNYFAGDIASIKTSLNSISKLIENKYVKYIEFNPRKPQLMNDTMVVRNRIKPVKLGTPPISQAYDGTGVIVGVMDSGIDFNHPDFKQSNGDTRIHFIWDQNQSSGSTIPQPYNYGIEWTAAQINASVCTHNDLPYYGHGTHVAGTAAGNGSAVGKFEGAAPKSTLIVVSLNFNNTVNSVFSDAVNYIFSKATTLGQPCVINASVGTYEGSHDATDLEAQLIKNLVTAQNGRVLVASAGNEGDAKWHVKTTLTGADTLFTWFAGGGTVKEYFLYADTNDIKNVQTSIGVNRPSFAEINRIPFHAYNYALSGEQVDTLKNSNNNRIGIVKTNASINSFGVYELYYKVLVDSLNYKWRIESKGAGKHDSWNFNFVSTGLPTATVYPKMAHYVMPDTISTIVSGFQCSNDIITVGNYINLNKWTDVTNTTQTTTEVPGKIKESSSQGPTRNNIIKPDISATGANIFSSMPIGLQNFLITNAPSAVAQGSMHVQGGGTSASAPVVAGLAALYLQAYPNATNQQVKQAIMNCAYTDGFTGTVPNNVYGYGKLDGMAAMLCTIFTGVNSVALKQGLNSYPNPFHEKVELQFENSLNGMMHVYDTNGKCLLEEKISGNSYTLQSEQLKNYKGLIFVQIQTETSSYSAKLITN